MDNKNANSTKKTSGKILAQDGRDPQAKDQGVELLHEDFLTTKEVAIDLWNTSCNDIGVQLAFFTTVAPIIIKLILVLCGI